MFIQTETTLNPEMLTFLPGCEVLGEGTLEINDKAQAINSPLAERLFALSGVTTVFLGGNSITVTKANCDWKSLKPAILEAITEHFMSGEPVLREGGDSRDQASNPPLHVTKVDQVDCIKKALRHVIDPELGHNIVDLGLVYDVTIQETGMVYIVMTTTTPGCPATTYLKEGARDSVRKVPGVEFVEVNLTYEPRWTPEMMSPAAKAHFGISDDDLR